jgi:purine-binding chemotaxis protein CheW
VIVEAGDTVAGVIVDHVDEVLTVTPEQISAAPGADPTLVNSIAHIGDRLVILLDPDSLFEAGELAA